MLRTLFLIFSLLTLALGNIANAAVYKWVDDKGNVHYSEQRPKDSNAEKIRVNSAPPSSTSTYKKPSLKTGEEDKNKSESAADGKGGMSAEEKQKLCAEARKDLQLMESTGRLRVKDAEGNVSVMSEEDKAARIQRNQERIKRYCQ